MLNLKHVLKQLKNLPLLVKRKQKKASYLVQKPSLEVQAFKDFLYDVLSIFRAHQYMYNMSFLLC